METRQNQLVHADQIAKEVGISQRWIIYEAKAGRLPHIKVESDFLFDLDTVKHLLRIRATFENLISPPPTLTQKGLLSNAS